MEMNVTHYSQWVPFASVCKRQESSIPLLGEQNGGTEVTHIRAPYTGGPANRPSVVTTALKSSKFQESCLTQ